MKFVFFQAPNFFLKCLLILYILSFDRILLLSNVSKASGIGFTDIIDLAHLFPFVTHHYLPLYEPDLLLIGFLSSTVKKHVRSLKLKS